MHQSVAAKIGGRQGLAATLLVLVGIVVVVVPTAALMNSLGDSVHRLINDVQNNTLRVPPPREGVDAPMPVILLGALGGMAAGGILGMFVGATLLALGYQIFMGWVATDAAAVMTGEG